jgi:hypothetical protein
MGTLVSCAFWPISLFDFLKCITCKRDFITQKGLYYTVCTFTSEEDQMSLRRPLRGAWWRPESRSRSALPNEPCAPPRNKQVDISKFSRGRSFRPEIRPKFWSTFCSAYVPHLRITCGKVMTLRIIYIQTSPIASRFPGTNSTAVSK